MERGEFWSNATAHYKERLNGELTPIDVPEWGGTLFYPASISLLRRDRIVKLHAEGGLKHMAQIVIETARTEEGKAMFRTRDMDRFLKEIDPDVTIRVAGEMAAAAAPPDEDEIAKNYGPTQKPGTDSVSATD
ncbi:MAG: hypothetical protein ABFS30_07440 [Pseudomonadota bacterium]